jgi:hypothetical protein
VNIVILSSGLRGDLVIQRLTHQVGLERGTTSRTVNLLLLDARHMSPECFAEACAKVGRIRDQLGIRLGLLLCDAPTLPMTVAAIRCGLRDVVSHFVTAGQLRQILRAAEPATRLRDYDGIVSLLRSLGGANAGSGAETDAAGLARRDQEITRRLDEISEVEKRLHAERETFDQREKDLRERTRRLDRQLARMQSDGDTAFAPPAAASSGPSPEQLAELEQRTRQLEQRAAELEVKEKLLTELQNLLLTTPAGAALKQQL